MRCSHQIRGLVNVKAGLYNAYGYHFVWYLVVVYMGVKGVSLQLFNNSMLPLFKQMGASSTDYQLASMLANSPWAAKGWLGLLSDCFPLGRYHKRGYLLLFSALGVAGSASLIAAIHQGIPANAKWWVALLYFLPTLQGSALDLLCEGKYTELMRAEKAGPEVVSLVWISISVGALIGSFAVVGLVDDYGAAPLILLASLPGLLAAWMTFRGCMPEKPIPTCKRGVQWAKLRSEPGLFLLAFCVAASALATSAVGAFVSSEGQFAVALGSTVALVVLSFRALPRTLAKGNLYMFLLHAMYLDLSGPLSYYYTADSSCIQDAPHFSYSYFLAVTSIVGAISGTFGTVFFQRIQSWSFRKAFTITTAIQVVASLFDIVIVKRWNIALGVPDEWAYLFGDAACQNLAGMLNTMPAILLMSRLCPRGAEATVFAIMAGFQNFGNIFASVLGVWLTRSLNIVTTNADGHACDTTNLATALVVAHLVLPLMCVPLAFVLVPAVRMDDEVAFKDDPGPPSFRSPASVSFRASPSEASTAASTPEAPLLGKFEEEPCALPLGEHTIDYCFVMPSEDQDP